MIETILTLNPDCMSDESGNWKYGLMNSGDHQGRMAKPITQEMIMPNKQVPQIFQAVRYFGLFIAIGAAIALQCDTIKQRAYELLTKPRIEERRHFEHPQRDLQYRMYQREEQPREIMV